MDRYSPLQVVEGTGSLSPDEYEQLAYDDNFLAVRTHRARTRADGVFVLIFLAFFFVPAYLLAREYKNNPHPREAQLENGMSVILNTHRWYFLQMRRPLRSAVRMVLAEKALRLKSLTVKKPVS